MNRAPATFLVRKKGLDAEARFVPATRVLCGGHRADHRQRLVLPLGPTPQPQDGTRRFAGVVDLFELAQPPRLATRTERLKAAGFTRPRRHGTCGGATRRGPARLLARLLALRPIACASAPPHAWRPRGEQRAAAGAQGERQRCRQGPRRGLAHPPGPREGTTFRTAMAHQRGTPAADAAALHDEPPRRQGEGRHQEVRLGPNVHLRQDVGVVTPPRQACDAAFRLGTVGHCRSDVRPLGALAAPHTAEERRQGDQGPGDRARRLTRILWCPGLPYGTIPAEVVTHRLRLLDWLGSPARVYDGATS